MSEESTGEDIGRLAEADFDAWCRDNMMEIEGIDLLQALDMYASDSEWHQNLKKSAP